MRSRDAELDELVDTLRDARSKNVSAYTVAHYLKCHGCSMGGTHLNLLEIN